MVDEETKRAIERAVARLLHEAGAKGHLPTPVENLVAAQKLQASKPEESPLSLTTLLKAPLELQRRLGSFKAKVLAVLDRRERIVHVRPDDLEVQQRFYQCHEVGHDLCPWHREDYFVDGAEQLDARVHDSFEKEANFAAAELLFQQDLFRTLSNSTQVGMPAVVDLAGRFGGSIHAAFRLYVETNLEPVAGLVLKLPEPGENLRFRIKQVFSSRKFGDWFSWLEDPSLRISSNDHPELSGAWRELRRGAIVGSGSLRLQARDGTSADVPFELFSNTYNVFMLLIPRSRSLLRRRVILSASSR